MSGEHPQDEHGGAHDAEHIPADDDAPDDAGIPSDASEQASTPDQSRPGPTPHRPAVWLAVFLIVVGLTVLVTIVGVVTDDGPTTGASSAAPSPTGDT